MGTNAASNWKHLAPKPGSAYRQLFVNGTRIMARILYGMYISEEEPRTAEEIAAAVLWLCSPAASFDAKAAQAISSFASDRFIPASSRTLLACAFP